MCALSCLHRLHVDLDYCCTRDAQRGYQLLEARSGSCSASFRGYFHAPGRSVPPGDRCCAPPSFPSDYGGLRQSRCDCAAGNRAAMAGGEDMLSQDVQAYLAVRRAMGFAMKWSGNLLRSFAAFSESAGQHHVRSEIAIKWAGSALSVRTRARRLGVVIRFARYLRAEDQRHEVPAPPFATEKRPLPTPYIYSRQHVQLPSP